MFRQISAFSFDSAQCFNPDDRAIVQDIIESIYGNMGNFERADHKMGNAWEVEEEEAKISARGLSFSMCLRCSNPMIAFVACDVGLVALRDATLSYQGHWLIGSMIVVWLYFPCAIAAHDRLAAIHLHTRSRSEEMLVIASLGLMTMLLIASTLVVFPWMFGEDTFAQCMVAAGLAGCAMLIWLADVKMWCKNMRLERTGPTPRDFDRDPSPPTKYGVVENCEPRQIPTSAIQEVPDCLVVANQDSSVNRAIDGILPGPVQREYL